ncbi:uncharacterized protein LOC106080042 isoform X2 [Biomphalaria glabrata]|uniref:Uncharacterized protein LOC106080042 isoform X2 n=1 Tax=Biomphalaria glabrata TaxID=6526 RepID=A0A9U8EPA0_BIOGL|nr:uncharacterized protein LOC106080042 isoform X2 [Biomphalaria glabrata]
MNGLNDDESSREVACNRIGFIARTNISQDQIRTDSIQPDPPMSHGRLYRKINPDSARNRHGRKHFGAKLQPKDTLEAICRDFDVPMYSRSSEGFRTMSSEFPPTYERAMSDNSETHPKELHSALMLQSSNSLVKTPFVSDAQEKCNIVEYSSGSGSDTDDEDFVAVDKQHLLREIETLKKQQEEMRRLQEMHDKRLQELLDREPYVNRRLETIRQSTKQTHHVATRQKLLFHKEGGMMLAQEHIYVQLEQLYENLHRMNYPTKTIQSVLGNNPQDTYCDANSVTEISTLRLENSILKKKVAELEKLTKPSALPRRCPPPPCSRGHLQTSLGQIQAKSMSNLLDIDNSSKEKFVAGRPTSPPPLPLTPQEIKPVEVTFKWTISDYSKKLSNEKITGRKECSSPFFLSHCGYRCQLEAYLNGNGTAKHKCISVFLRIIKGDYDRYLKWPVNLHLVVILVNQSGNQQDSLKADGNQFQYQKPCGVAETESDCWGLIEFVSHKLMQQRRYIKDDSIVLKCRIMILPM